MNGKRPGGWVALACRYFRDPRFDDVSADAELLWLHALAYCGEQETDGHVARGALPGLSQRLSGPESHAAAELVQVGLWVTTGRGYRFPAWERWQSTADQSQRARARAAERKAGWRATRQGTTPGTNGGTDQGSPGGSPGGSPQTSGAGAGAVRSTTSPAPRRQATPGGGQDPNGETEWEEYTDAAGNLYVRAKP